MHVNLKRTERKLDKLDVKSHTDEIEPETSRSWVTKSINSTMLSFSVSNELLEKELVWRLIVTH